ncbi:hypothetical protein HN51_001980 [Arachis hypogaea]
MLAWDHTHSVEIHMPPTYCRTKSNTGWRTDATYTSTRMNRWLRLRLKGYYTGSIGGKKVHHRVLTSQGSTAVNRGEVQWEDLVGGQSQDLVGGMEEIRHLTLPTRL